MCFSTLGKPLAPRAVAQPSWQRPPAGPSPQRRDFRGSARSGASRAALLPEPSRSFQRRGPGTAGGGWPSARRAAGRREIGDGPSQESLPCRGFGPRRFSLRSRLQDRGAQRRAGFLRQADGAAATCGGHRAGVRRPPAQQEVLALVPRNRISHFDSPCWLSHLNFI